MRAALSAIAAVRKRLPALQRGVQVNLEFNDETAAFYRVYQHDGQTQTALVLLNKGNEPAEFPAAWLSEHAWQDELTGQTIDDGDALRVAPHAVSVLSIDRIPAAMDEAVLRSLHETARRTAN